MVLLAVVLALPARAAEDEARPSTPSDNVQTNELLFKKRVRRRYDTPAIVSEPMPALSPKVSTNVDEDTPAPDSSRPRSSGELLRSSNALPPPHPTATPPRKLRRAKEEDEWLTPEQRLARELKKIQSGEDDQKEKKDSDVFDMTAEVVALGDKQRKEARDDQERKDDEAVLEEIALLLGEQWLLDTSDAAFKFREYSFRQSMEASRQRVSGSEDNAQSSPSLSRLSLSRTDASRQRSEPAEHRDLITTMAQHRGDPRASESASDSDSITAELSARSEPQGLSSSPSPPAPAIFDWSESKAGRFAGLPASLAPSIVPSLTPNSPVRAPPPPVRSLVSAPEAGLGSPGAAGGLKVSSSWTLPSSVAPSGPSELARPATPPQASPWTQPLRTPFINPTPGIPSPVRP